MRQAAFIVGVFALLASGGRLAAESPVSQPAEANAAVGDANAQAAERQRRTNFMQTLLRQYAVATVDRQQTPLVLSEEPVLRYTNPVRNFHTDGGVFFWLEDERPFAAASPTIRGTGEVFCEFTALTGQPLECRREGRVLWAPRSGNLVDQSLNGSAPPDPSDKVRLRQMRGMARRFQVITKSEPDVELRLMAQPIYRFAAEGSGITDGAVFAFVEATDPDFLLVLEAHRARPASASEWRFTLARLCSRPVEVKLDGQRLWSAENYWKNPRSVNDPYAEKLMGPYPPPKEKVRSR